MQTTTQTRIFVPAALQIPSSRWMYRFGLSASLFLLMLFTLTFHYSEVGFFILVFINVLFCADLFGRSAWADLKRGRIGFSFLVSLEVGAGFSYSACHTFLPSASFGSVQELYLYVSLFLTLSLAVQSYLLKERERANVYIKKIDDFLPKSGRKISKSGEQKVFATELKPGDTILVKPGEHFPCDGEIIQGKTTIDEQLITGNRIASYKQPGSKVYAATVNKSAEVKVRVTTPLPQATIMQVISSVQNSTRRQSNLLPRLDVYAAWTLAFLVVWCAGRYGWNVFLGNPVKPWAEIGRTLVTISLGTPVALLFAEIFPVGFIRRKALESGIRLQNRHALDLFCKTDTVVFDKTGTLTQGELYVKAVQVADKKQKRVFLEALACAEQQIEGPFAQAIMQYTQAQKIQPASYDSLEILPSLGIQVKQGQDIILAGRIGWMEEQQIELPKTVYQEEQTVICVAKNGVYLGYLTLADTLREGAEEAIEFLVGKKKEILLVSGDNAPAVSSVANQLNVQARHANALPQDKAVLIDKLCAQGKQVAMVGDGFNDIVALLHAQVSLAFASEQNVYSHWVDVVILKKDMGIFKRFYALHQKMRRVCFSNVILAVGLSVAWVEMILARAPQVSDWRWTVGGSLAIVALVFLNSTRLSK